jgi:PAS domain-containing protein
MLNVMDRATFIELLNSLPIAAAITEDAECRKMTVNKAMAKIMQTIYNENVSPGASFMSSPFYKVFHNGKALAVEQLPLRQAVLEGKDIKDFEMDILHPDGSMSTVMAFATAWREDGKITGGYAVYQNITELRTTQMEVQSLKNDRDSAAEK